MEEPVKFRAKVFNHKDGQRFIVPSFAYMTDDPDASPANIIIDAMMFSVVTGCKMEEQWGEWDVDSEGMVQVNHAKTELIGRQFAHGACTVYLLM